MSTTRTLSLVCLAACASTTTSGGQPDASPLAAVDAPSIDPLLDGPGQLYDPAKPGPWKVGVHTVRLTDPARNRSFSADVWYPVDPATADGSSNTYELDSVFGSIASIDSPARRDATAAPGIRPLVLFSHGYGGIRFQSYFITEQLASHGFVVVSPDHPGNTLTDFAQLGNDAATAQSATDRPLDLAYALTAALTDKLGVAVTIDPMRIGATGHSFGGWTCLELARRDPRIRVVFPMAPGFRGGATADFVATLARPLLFIGGSEDSTCDFPENQQAPYAIAQTPKYLLEVMGAGHLDFSNLCEVPIAQQLVNDGCDPAKIDPAIVLQRSKTVATAFVRRYLLGETGYDVYLTPSSVSALGNVQYWSAP